MKNIPLQASFIDGQFYEQKIPIYIPCSGYVVVGNQSRRVVDQDECITEYRGVFVVVGSTEYGILGYDTIKLYALLSEKCAACAGCEQTRPKEVVQWVYLNEVPEDLTSVLFLNSQKFFTGKDISIPVRDMGVDRAMVIRYAAGQPDPLSWYNTSENSGPVPDQLFRVETIGQYKYVTSKVNVTMDITRPFVLSPLVIVQWDYFDSRPLNNALPYLKLSKVAMVARNFAISFPINDMPAGSVIVARYSSAVEDPVVWFNNAGNYGVVGDTGFYAAVNIDHHKFLVSKSGQAFTTTDTVVFSV